MLHKSQRNRHPRCQPLASPIRRPWRTDKKNRLKFWTRFELRSSSLPLQNFFFYHSRPILVVKPWPGRFKGSHNFRTGPRTMFFSFLSVPLSNPSLHLWIFLVHCLCNDAETTGRLSAGSPTTSILQNSPSRDWSLDLLIKKKKSLGTSILGTWVLRRTGWPGTRCTRFSPGFMHSVTVADNRCRSTLLCKICFKRIAK